MADLRQRGADLFISRAFRKTGEPLVNHEHSAPIDKKGGPVYRKEHQAGNCRVPLNKPCAQILAFAGLHLPMFHRF
jgi:hypothetical protein